jgi:hypothetical protein
MKLLTFFFLLTITCLGQSKYSSNIFVRDSILYYYGIPANTPLHKIPISILNDIEEYEWECFGDSNKQYYRFEKTGKILVDTEIAENCKCILPFFYTHREPTFTGFMEFVQKKYGRK